MNRGGIFDHGVVDADGKVEHLEILLGEVLRLGFLDDYRPAISKAENDRRHPEESDLGVQSHKFEEGEKKRTM